MQEIRQKQLVVMLNALLRRYVEGDVEGFRVRACAHTHPAVCLLLYLLTAQHVHIIFRVHVTSWQIQVPREWYLLGSEAWESPTMLRCPAPLTMLGMATVYA